MTGAWLVWGIGVVALVVPSTLGLTVMRMASAMACGAAVLSWSSGASPIPGAVFLTGALICGFLIGGADGHTEALRACADFRWSLSPLTLQHEFALVLVLEQLYRARTLNAGLPYHRD